MGYLNNQLEKVAAPKLNFMQRLKPAVMNAAARTNQKLLNYNAMGLDPTIVATVAAPMASAHLASKLGPKVLSWLKSKIKLQSKSIAPSSNDASWLANTNVRDRLSTANKFKISL